MTCQIDVFFLTWKLTSVEVLSWYPILEIEITFVMQVIDTVFLFTTFPQNGFDN